MADVQIAVIDQQNTQLTLAAPDETQVSIAVPGVQGPKGEGVPLGGSANQVLFKQSGTNYDTAWGNVTSAMIGDLEIVNADVATAAAIAGTKISPNFGSQNVVTTGTSTAASFIPSSSSVPTNGLYLPSANFVALATNGTGRLFVDANGDITSNTSPSTGLGVRLYGTATGTNVDATTSRGVTLFLHQTSNTNNNTSAILFVNALTNTGAYIAGQYTSHTNRQTALVFGTGDNAAPVERFRITSDGKVGLGTSAPDRLLHLSAADTAYLRLENQDSTGSVDQYVGLIEFEGQDTGGSGVRAQVGAIYEGVSGATALTFGTSADAGSVTERLRINRNGNVGIGVTGPSELLELSGGNLSIYHPSTGNGAGYSLLFKSNGGSTGATLAQIVASQAGTNVNTANLRFLVANAGSLGEAARIDSSGRLLVGTSSARSNFYNTTAATRLQIEGTNFEGSSAALIRNSNDNSSSAFVFAKSRGTATGSNTVTQSGDFLGEFAFQGNDGSEFVAAAAIAAVVDGTPGADDMPGRLVFSTTADGAASPTERLRITSAGVLQIADAGNIAVGTTTGTKIGTATTQKLGFYNKTPVVQPTAVADATDAASVITQLNALLARMRDLGLIAT